MHLEDICPKHIIVTQVAASLAEDLSVFPDWSSSLIAADKEVSAQIITREEIVLCGIAWAEQVFKLCETNDAKIECKWHHQDGEYLGANTLIATITGNARGILKAERSALNFLQTLSGTATIVKQYVDVVKHSKVKIMDTRKTLPGLRLAQKYAVVVGGGHNQRMGLYDGALIKENHILACGGVANALNHAAAIIPKHIPIQIEVETFEELVEAYTHGAKLILLDNMSPELIKKCVVYVAGRATLEVSGGVNLSNILQYATTGVDRISVGALTKDIHATDLSLLIHD